MRHTHVFAHIPLTRKRADCRVPAIHAMSTVYDSRLHRILEEEFRTITGLSQASGIERTRLHHIVHGRRASNDEAEAIARALGRDDIDEVFPPEVAA